MLTEEWLKIVAKTEGYNSLSKLIIAKSDTKDLLDTLERYMDDDESGQVEDWALDILALIGHKTPQIILSERFHPDEVVEDEDTVYERWRDENDDT